MDWIAYTDDLFILLVYVAGFAGALSLAAGLVEVFERIKRRRRTPMAIYRRR